MLERKYVKGYRRMMQHCNGVTGFKHVEN